MAGQRGLLSGLYYETLFWNDDPTPPLVVLPGLLSDGRQVRRLLRELHRKAVVVDPLGSGNSESPAATSEYALAALVPRLHAVLDSLAIKRADLLGLSMGGMWAQHALLKDRFAAAPPRFRSAVLVGSCAQVGPRLRSLLLGLRALWQHDLPQLAAWRILQALLFSAEFLERPSTVPLLELLGSEARTGREAALCQLDALLGHELFAELAGIGSVRCVLGGQLDVLMPPFVQAELSTALGGTAVRILEGAGHAVWIEKPAALAEAVAAALPALAP